MGQLVDAWKKLQMDMEVARLQMQIDTQQKILEASKSMWETHKFEMEMWDNPTKKSMEEKTTKLNIQNIQKLENQPLVSGKYYPRIESIEERDNEYVFTIMVDIGVNLKNVRKVIWLERNKNLTSNRRENYYMLWGGDENFEQVNSKCISNLDCFKEKLVNMLGVLDLSESGGDSAKLQKISDLLDGIGKTNVGQIR
jgi:hypothetical protein